MATEWYYRVMNDVVGPLSSRNLLDVVRAGQIKHDTLIRKDDSQWVPAGQVSGLLDAADQSASRRICPYCGHSVGEAPTICEGCNRKLVLSVNSRLTSLGRTNNKRVIRDQQEDVEQRKEKLERLEIVKYFLLLFLVIGLLLAAPYMMRLAAGEAVPFDGQLAAALAIGVTVLGGGFYFLFARLA